jgi:hypothetical protein
MIQKNKNKNKNKIKSSKIPTISVNYDEKYQGRCKMYIIILNSTNFSKSLGTIQ